MKLKEINYFLDSVIIPQSQIIIGVSGGPDSMCLLDCIKTFFITKKYSLKNIVVIHCNHNTRFESKNELKILKKQCSQFSFISFSYSGTEKNEESLRNRRHSCFKKILIKNNINQLFLGHNLDDRIETTILNLIRGSGIQGFSNMTKQDSQENYTIIRPLLEETKQSILNYCAKNNISYFTDPTNSDTTTSLRNLIRHTILPKITQVKLSENKNKTYQSFSNIYQEIEQYKNQKGALEIKKLYCSQYRNSKQGFLVDQEIKTVEQVYQIFLFLKIHGKFTTNIGKERGEFFRKNKDGRKFCGGWFFFKCHSKIYLIESKEIFRETFNTKNQPIKKGEKIVFGDFELSAKNEGTLRFPKLGDKFGSKSVKKILINKKVPLFRRNYIPLIEKDGKIIEIIIPNQKMLQNNKEGILWN